MAFSKRSALSGMGVVGLVAGQALTASAGHGERAKEVEVGRDLAVAVCSPCHIVSAEASEQRHATAGGPSFLEIAQGPKGTPEALRDFLHSTQSSVAHPGAMPNPQLTEGQINVIAAYLSSLRHAR